MRSGRHIEEVAVVRLVILSLQESFELLLLFLLTLRRSCIVLEVKSLPQMQGQEQADAESRIWGKSPIWRR